MRLISLSPTSLPADHATMRDEAGLHRRLQLDDAATQVGGHLMGEERVVKHVELTSYSVCRPRPSRLGHRAEEIRLGRGGR